MSSCDLSESPACRAGQSGHVLLGFRMHLGYHTTYLRSCVSARACSPGARFPQSARSLTRQTACRGPLSPAIAGRGAAQAALLSLQGYGSQGVAAAQPAAAPSQMLQQLVAAKQTRNRPNPSSELVHGRSRRCTSALATMPAPSFSVWLRRAHHCCACARGLLPFFFSCRPRSS